MTIEKSDPFMDPKKLPTITRKGLRLIVFDGPNPIVVIRPTNPDFAIQLANRSLNENDGELFQKIIESQDYTYRGFLGRNHKIVNENGVYQELVKPGDSFVCINQNISN